MSKTAGVDDPLAHVDAALRDVVAVSPTRINISGDSLEQAGVQNVSSTEHVITEEELQHSVLIFYVVLIVMIAAQSALVRWRARHRRSYDFVTLIGLWMVPAIISVQLGFWRFLLVWSAYTGVTSWFLYACLCSDLWDTSVPKNIYKWFLGVFRVSVGIGLTGYLMLLVDVLSGGLLFSTFVENGLSLLLIWYGLYFGILTRDCAEVISDRMVAGFVKHHRIVAKSLNVRDCALCGVELQDSMSHLFDGAVEASEKRDSTVRETSTRRQNGSKSENVSIQLPNCKHVFHPECIKGWLIVGKKDTCPMCNEKADLREVCADTPWETRNLSWIQMLDMVRYLVVWQPTIMTGLHILFHLLKWDSNTT
jgi:RING finger protein 121